MGWRATVADQRQRAEQAERERDDLRKGYATWSAEIHQMREERDEARAKVERLRSALGDLTAQTYVAHHANPDHACSRCVPDGPILVSGFRCAFHEARAALEDSK
jgi:septal ring factor EnvC (AmiA/AmiB activator)